MAPLIYLSLTRINQRTFTFRYNFTEIFRNEICEIIGALLSPSFFCMTWIQFITNLPHTNPSPFILCYTNKCSRTNTSSKDAQRITKKYEGFIGLGEIQKRVRPRSQTEYLNTLCARWVLGKCLWARCLYCICKQEANWKNFENYLLIFFLHATRNANYRKVI